MRLDVLWQFMQVDMEADRFETKMRQSENRQKLLKQRNILMDQQAKMKKLESEVAVMQDRLEAVQDEAQRLEKVLSGLFAEFEANPPKTAVETAERMQAVQKVQESLFRYEQELQKMRKDSMTKDEQQKSIRVLAAKTKQEYDQLKKVYDQEYKVDSAKLQELRKTIEAESAKVEPDMLELYRGIKQHCTPPMSKLINGQCSGCFMSPSAATLIELKANDHVVECDNCGRIIYVGE